MRIGLRGPFDQHIARLRVMAQRHRTGRRGADPPARPGQDLRPARKHLRRGTFALQHHHVGNGGDGRGPPAGFPVAGIPVAGVPVRGRSVGGTHPAVAPPDQRRARVQRFKTARQIHHPESKPRELFGVHPRHDPHHLGPGSGQKPGPGRVTDKGRALKGRSRSGHIGAKRGGAESGIGQRAAQKDLGHGIKTSDAPPVRSTSRRRRRR